MADTNMILDEVVKSVLGENASFSEDENLLKAGLNSIKVMRIVGLLKKKNIKVSFVDMIKAPTIASWRAICSNATGTSENKSMDYEVIQKETRAPFALTDVQKAYLIGREEGQPLGGVSCHVYVEFDNQNLDIDRLKQAWQKLINHHGMLRAKFNRDGTQQILDEVTNEVTVQDLRSMSEEQRAIKLANIRDDLSHRKLDVENGTNIGLAVSIIDNDLARMHFDLDLLVADVVSFKIILDDLANLYLFDKEPETSDWDFSNYLSKKKLLDTDKYNEDKKYWEGIIPQLPVGSTLPVATHPEKIVKATYRRLKFVLSNQERELLKKYATQNNTTPSMVLLSLYSLVLERWSENSKFLINIPLFNRDLAIKGTENAVADFTDLLILDMDVSKSSSLSELVNSTQQNFYEKYQHSAYSGMEVQRELLFKNNATIVAPVVFSCTEGIELISKESVDAFGAPGFMLTQTPQVYIDFQTFQINKELVCIWDVPDSLFPEGMAEEMFAALENAVRNVLKTNGEWNISLNDFETIFDHCTEKNVSINDIGEQGNLHEAFFENAKQHPNDIALIDAELDSKLKYSELAFMVRYTANLLRESGVKANDKVAITVNRGINEIIGILAIVSIGACYVPITPRQPVERRVKAIGSMGVNWILTDEINAADSSMINGVDIIEMRFKTGVNDDFDVTKFESDRSAYVILTSGTTGEPKGVEISHAGAINTIRDINERISLKKGDKILAVSSIDFDLSVYDIFGTLSAGATLVVVGGQHYRDAEYWYETVQKYNINVWNSVPMLFDMLLTVAEVRGEKLPLRAVMLSGDWVSSELPPRLREMSNGCRFIGMGGATEASIWSNWYEVEGVSDIRGKFVPYGWALKNQAYRIVDSQLRDCPHWVPGELLIGGVGLAKGYCNDPKKTDEKFIETDSGRWYRTGDRGRYHMDGCIEFLGRIDQQCKVRGHRIEVEEIEKCMEKYFDGLRVIVWPEGNEGAYNRLLSCVFGLGHEIDSTEEGKIVEFLNNNLPSYMIPTEFYSLEKMPLSSNGKVDRKAIREIFRNVVKSVAEEGNADDEYQQFLNEMKTLWCENLGLSNIADNDNYFVIGGDSLKAIKLMSAINKKFGIKLESRDVFEYQEFLLLAEKVYKQIIINSSH